MARTFWVNMLIANVIGYTIHAPSSWAACSGLERWRAQRRLAVTGRRTTRCIPTLSVFVGLLRSSALLLDIGFRAGSPEPRVDRRSSLFSSLVISIMLSASCSSGASAPPWPRPTLERERAARRAHRARGAVREPARAAGADRAALPLQHARQRDQPHRPDPAKAKRMLESFIRFLRASLARHAQRVDHARRRGRADRRLPRRARGAHGLAAALLRSTSSPRSRPTRCRRCCCSRSSRTRSATASSPRSKAARCACARAARRAAW